MGHYWLNKISEAVEMIYQTARAAKNIKIAHEGVSQNRNHSHGLIS